VVTAVAYTGEVTDAPDWERVVVGPGGTPLTPGISTTSSYNALAADTVINGTPKTLCTVTAPANGLYIVLATLNVFMNQGAGCSAIMNVNFGTATATGNAIQSATTVPYGDYGSVSGFILMEVTNPGTILMKAFTVSNSATALGPTGGFLPGAQTVLGLVGPL
jgi:hypothetical protein